MALSALPDGYWARLSELTADAMGLHFPRERWSDLQRGVVSAAAEFGFTDVEACADWLLSSPLSKAQLQVLASHLTIGETYFFRDKPTLASLTEHILPEMIHARRGRDQRLRIWSAACCSGEEPYTLAILLHQLLPDLANWRVSIHATDINPRFLHKASAGLYGEWSFRDVPDAIRKRYFSRASDGRYAVNPEIRRLVRFAHLNLVEDVYPSPVTDTNAMDLICCRNVLMYFTAVQIAKVVNKLRHALVDGGWLVVSPSEAPHATSSGLTTVNFPGAILYQKRNAPPQKEYGHLPTLVGASAEFDSAPTEAAVPWISPAETADTLMESNTAGVPDPQAYSLLARELANQGKLADALVCCDLWIAIDRSQPLGHYLRALILIELGDFEGALLSLRRTLFLHPDFALAHFTLGNLARERDRSTEAQRHFANALRALRHLSPGDLLAGSDGLTAGRLTEIIGAMTETENSP